MGVKSPRFTVLELLNKMDKQAYSNLALDSALEKSGFRIETGALSPDFLRNSRAQAYFGICYFNVQQQAFTQAGQCCH